MKQSKAVASSASLLGFATSIETSLPVKTALAAARTLDTA
jgi:hypothetical protein